MSEYEAALAMREAAAQTAYALAGANSYKAMVCDEISAAIRALPLPAPALIAAAEERDDLRRKLRKCTINKDELWKVARADADKMRQLKADGEDVAQMLVQRDKEADEALAAANARVAELEKLLKPFANSSIVERFEGREDEMPLEADETITLGDFRRAARLLNP